MDPEDLADDVIVVVWSDVMLRCHIWMQRDSEGGQVFGLKWGDDITSYTFVLQREERKRRCVGLWSIVSNS